MSSILFWVGVLVVVSVLSPVLKLLIAAVAGKQIGADALAQQPDRIRLQDAAPSAWKNAAGARKVIDALASRGFQDAGLHSITEMPGVLVQLLANPRDSFYAAVYEHPQAGIWFDLVSGFQDGTSVTYSTSRPTALKPRPGHTNVNMPGLDPVQMLEKALSQRPRSWLQTVSADQAVTVFEQAYAESIAYRKAQGISTREVVETAVRKAA